MKKSIIILSIALVLLLTACVFAGKDYIDTLSTFYSENNNKKEAIDNKLELENKLREEKRNFDSSSASLLTDNIGCKLWKNQEEMLNQIKE